LKAGRAFGIFVGFLGGQIAGAMVLGMVAALIVPHVVRNPPNSAVTGHMSQTFIAIASLFGVIVGAIIMFALARRLGRHQLCDRNPTGAAWVRGSVKQLGLGCLSGILVAGFSFVVNAWVFPVKDLTHIGPLTQLAITPGVAQVSWVILAILIAPPVEELLFRGIVFGGFARSFGLVWSAIWTTALFLVLHIPEVMYHWPAIIGVCAMAFAALFLRLRTRAIGPAVALHVGYNAVIVSLVIIGTHM
jgi:membrane protease YdiL (CAAX protease family)